MAANGHLRRSSKLYIFYENKVYEYLILLKTRSTLHILGQSVLSSLPFIFPGILMLLVALQGVSL